MRIQKLTGLLLAASFLAALTVASPDTSARGCVPIVARDVADAHTHADSATAARAASAACPAQAAGPADPAALKPDRGRSRYAGFATYDLQFPPGLIGPFTTLHVPQLPAAGAGMNCWQF